MKPTESELKIVQAVMDEMRSDNNSFERAKCIKRISAKNSHFGKIVKLIQDKEIETAEPLLKLYADELGQILDQAKEICSNCKKYASSHAGLGNPEPMGCCDACFREAGYFKRPSYGEKEDEIAFRKHIGYLKDTYGWDHVYGFWSAKGCMLPRHERSHVCQDTLCDSAQTKLGAEATKRVHFLTNEIKRLRFLLLKPAY